MKKQASLKKTNGISTGVLLISLGILAFLNSWWPGILIVLGVSLGLRQYLLGRYYDMGFSFLIFFGLFIIIITPLPFNFLVPILFILAGIYMLCREFLIPDPTTEIEEEEEIELEIEEDSKN